MSESRRRSRKGEKAGVRIWKRGAQTGAGNGMEGVEDPSPASNCLVLVTTSLSGGLLFSCRPNFQTEDTDRQGCSTHTISLPSGSIVQRGSRKRKPHQHEAT